MREEMKRYDGEQAKSPFKWNDNDSSITDADGYTVLVVGGVLKNGQAIAAALNARANTRDRWVAIKCSGCGKMETVEIGTCNASPDLTKSPV